MALKKRKHEGRSVDEPEPSRVGSESVSAALRNSFDSFRGLVAAWNEPRVQEQRRAHFGNATQPGSSSRERKREHVDLRRRYEA